MATAVRAMSDVDLGIEQEIERQRANVRQGEITRENGQGGWTVLGPMIEFRYERSASHPAMRPELVHYFADCGNVCSWESPKNGPLIGLARDRQKILICSRIKPLPDVPDTRWKQDQFVTWDGNRVPLASIPPDMRKGLKNSDGSLVAGTDAAIRRPQMIHQSFADHAAGTMGEYVVIRPVTECLIKLAGIQALQICRFSPIGNDYTGFYLNPATGEGFFVGGSMDIDSPLGAR